ncbi:N-acetylmuramoyl-L-alanine amidase family protein [Neobacillus dielmonensis]|uniref:N-acetylmuramoyl-L-alanine amidase family protein n=1 Tax=Neobacillus dielmonensis TaxID=1347369 RepID=UPI0006934117|nr:N-acetylmuramoyl-L-alanine amidase [Neobacillus dielmonensis]
MKLNKTIKIGLTVFVLIMVFPIYLLLHHADEENAVKGESELETAKAVKGEKVVAQSHNTDAEEGNQEQATQNENVAPSNEAKAVENNFIVVIDPGHQEKANLAKEPVGPGGTDMKLKVSGGTTGVVTGKPEYILTLEASLILGNLLESKGVKVIYTRTTHNVNLSNQERAEIANQNNADLFIRIHADGSTNQNVHGLSVLTPAKESPYTTAIYEDSLKASQFIIDETSKNPEIKVNGISYRGDLSGFNWSKVPSTLVEMGFMSNPTEDRNLSDQSYLTKLLENVADGIMDYADYKQ